MADSILAFIKQFAQILQWWVSVAPWEQGIRVRLGRHVKLLHAGVSLRIPFVDTVYVQSVRRRVATMPSQTVTAKNGKPITIGATLAYAIADVALLYDTLEHAEGSIVNEAATALALAAGELDLITPATLGEAATSRLRFSAYGLEGVAIQVTDLVSVRTIRLIQDPRWSMNENLRTTDPRGL